MAEGNTSATEVEKNVNVSEDDIARMIEFLSQHGKYKVLTTEEFELMSHSKPSIKKEGPEVAHWPTAHKSSTPKASGDKPPPRPQPPRGNIFMIFLL